MNSFSLQASSVQGFPVVHLAGYLAADSREPFFALVEERLEKGEIRMVFDFSGCTLINSPGVVVLMDLAYRVVEDFKGQLVLTGLDELKMRVLKIAGVFPRIQAAPTIRDGLELLGEK